MKITEMPLLVFSTMPSLDVCEVVDVREDKSCKMSIANFVFSGLIQNVSMGYGIDLRVDLDNQILHIGLSDNFLRRLEALEAKLA